MKKTSWNAGTRKNFETCPDCGKVRYHQGKKGLRRCRQCYFNSLKGIRPEQAIQAAILANTGNSYRKGQTFSEESKRKISQSRKGQKVGKENNKWEGDEVGYGALHSWISRILGKPTQCKNCGRDGLTEHQIHWANISREYKRDISDWIRLCAKCHYKYDGLAEKRWKNHDPKCKICGIRAIAKELCNKHYLKQWRGVENYA